MSPWWSANVFYEFINFQLILTEISIACGDQSQYLKTINENGWISPCFPSSLWQTLWISAQICYSREGNQNEASKLRLLQEAIFRKPRNKVTFRKRRAVNFVSLLLLRKHNKRYFPNRKQQLEGSPCDRCRPADQLGTLQSQPWLLAHSHGDPQPSPRHVQPC